MQCAERRLRRVYSLKVRVAIVRVRAASTGGAIVVIHGPPTMGGVESAVWPGRIADSIAMRILG